MRLKSGVSLEKVSPQVLLALTLVDQLFFEAGARKGLMLTSLYRFGDRSWHKDGNAFDLRLLSRLLAEQAHISWTKQTTPKDTSMAVQMRIELGSDWDVLLESHQPDQYDWHLHVEYDPKLK